MKKRILCFGDSNTWGAIPEESSRYPEDVRWTGLLQKKLGDGYQIIEEGYNGRTTVFDDPIEGRLSGIAYFAPCFASQSPLDLIILMLGTNDLKLRFGVNAKTIASGFNRYLDVLKTAPNAGTNPKLLIVSPIKIAPSYKKSGLYDMLGEKAVERSSQFAEAYREFADMAGAYFLDAALFAKASERDGVHMEPEEHHKLAIGMLEKVKEILG